MFTAAKSLCLLPNSRRASAAFWGPAPGWPCGTLDDIVGSLFWLKAAATVPTKPKLVPTLPTATLCGSVRRARNQAASLVLPFCPFPRSWEQSQGRVQSRVHILSIDEDEAEIESIIEKCKLLMEGQLQLPKTQGDLRMVIKQRGRDTYHGGRGT